MSEDAVPDNVTWFCRQARARSREHQAAMSVVAQSGWSSIAVGILRQELDSMVRVIYLLQQRDPEIRMQLLQQAVAGERRWKVPTNNGKLKVVTDREMVDLAGELDEGWTRLVYKFGCGFIHLSELHDYNARDPFRSLSLNEREDIVRYLSRYHDADASTNSTFSEIVAYVPKILGKITSNLEHYLEDLEGRASPR